MYRSSWFLFFILISNIVYCQSNAVLSVQLDKFFQKFLENNSTPGVAASIIKEGQIVWSGTYGLANVNLSDSVKPDTEFTLASISKLFTATACIKLSEEGLLDLDADINSYLPISVLNPNFPLAPITARQLLQHKSSLRDFESDLQLWGAAGDPIYDLATFCQAYFTSSGFLYVSSNFNSATGPGSSSYWYSNAGFTLLGYIVEQISGMPFNEYCKSTILQPLTMIQSGWFYSEVDSTGLAMPYDISGNPYGYYSVPEYPAAMLKANIIELSQFLIAYTQHGSFQDTTLFSELSYDLLVPATMTNGFAWWGTDTWWGDPTGAFWSHGGFMNGVRTQLNYYPEDSTGLIILTNGESGYQLIQDELESYIPLFESEAPSGLQFEEQFPVNVFPNPAHYKIVIISDNSKKKITISQQSNSRKKEIETSLKRVEIDISEFEVGTLLITIEGDNYSTYKKIIKI